MFTQLKLELQQLARLVTEKWGLKHKAGHVKQSGIYIAEEYKRTSASTRYWLKVSGILVVLALLMVMAVLAWTSPSVARLFGLPVPVGGYHVRVGKIEQVIGASGVVQEHATINVMSRVVAAVQKVPISMGDLITTNSLLMESDNSTYLPAYTGAVQGQIASKLTVQKDADQVKVMEVLRKENLAADVEVEEAKATLAAAQEADALNDKTTAEDKLALDFTRLKSPINGIVITRQVDPGDSLVVGTPVFVLGDLEKVYLVALVQEDMVSFMTKGATAEIVFSSLPSQTFHGFVEKIDPTVDSTTRTFQAYVVIDNPKMILKPGLTGFARITLERTGLMVPDTAILNQYGEEATIFVVDQNSRANLTTVREGLHGEGNFEVISGLKEGDAVVTPGSRYLKDHERVHLNFRRQDQ